MKSRNFITLKGCSASHLTLHGQKIMVLILAESVIAEALRIHFHFPFIMYKLKKSYCAAVVMGSGVIVLS